MASERTYGRTIRCFSLLLRWLQKPEQRCSASPSAKPPRRNGSATSRSGSSPTRETPKKSHGTTRPPTSTSTPPGPTPSRPPSSRPWPAAPRSWRARSAASPSRSRRGKRGSWCQWGMPRRWQGGSSICWRMTGSGCGWGDKRRRMRRGGSGERGWLRNISRFTGRTLKEKAYRLKRATL